MLIYREDYSDIIGKFIGNNDIEINYTPFDKFFYQSLLVRINQSLPKGTKAFVNQRRGKGMGEQVSNAL